MSVCTLFPSAPLTPFHMGPTWDKNPDGSWKLPELTLGWIIIGWCAENLQLDGEPWQFTAEQMRFILWLYAIDRRGRFIYRDIVLQRMKGWGKDPIAAVIAAVEFVGPCRFDYWLTGGEASDLWSEGAEPVARENPDAWVQIVAVSQEQTKNTMTLMGTLFTPECISEHGIDLGKQIIYAYSGTRRIEVTSSSYRSMEGNRPSFVIRNETHHWLKTNDGHELQKVIRRNLGKIKGGQARALSITNAYSPGEGSVAQSQRESYLGGSEGNPFPSTVMYDSLEAPVGSTLFPTYTGWDEDGNIVVELGETGQPIPPSLEVVKHHLRRIIEAVRGDSTWLDIDRLIEDIIDPDTTVEESKRFYFNSVTLDDDASFDPDDIAATAHVEIAKSRKENPAQDQLRCGWRPVLPSDPIVIFGDGSKSNDSTGLIGCRLSDGYVFTIGVWQKPPGERGRNWLAPRDEIDLRVREAFGRFNVVAFWYDPSHAKDDQDATRYWDGLIDQWHVDFGDRLQYWAVNAGDRRTAIGWDMTSAARQIDFVKAVERFTDEMESHTVTHDGHPALIDHLRNARMHMTAAGLSVGKASRSSKKKIDLAVCAIGARMLRRALMLKGLEEEAPTNGRVWGVSF